MVKIQLHPQGTRVRIRQGHFPLDPSIIGRTGIVIVLHRVGGERYGVQLDGESRIRVFTEDELEVVVEAGSLEEAGERAGGSGSDVPA